MADFVAIGLRGLAFAAALQAAGVPIFLSLVGRHIDRSLRAIRAVALVAAIAALLLTVAHAVIEPARLTGDLAGIFDGSLQALLLASDSGTAVAVRVLGLALLLGASLKPGRAAEAAALSGGTLVAVSFTFMGHTAASDLRWLLAPLLIVHLAIIGFWFGGFGPLLLVARYESTAVAGSIIEEFSRAAIRLVPVIPLAGIAMMSLLLPDLSSLRTPYGLALIAKIVGFSLLLGLAAANRWRFGPRIAAGDRLAVAAFRRSVVAEWLLILVVVLISAAMTALFSPGH